MTVTSLGNLSQYIQAGGTYRQGCPSAAALGTIALNANLYSSQMIGNIHWADGGNHTMTTAGASQIQWRSGSLTYAGATTFIVGIAEVDTAAGPPARAVNSSDTITFDIYKTYTSSTGLTTTAWNTTTLDSGSTKTINHGALVAVCFQMTVKGGSDALAISSGPTNLQNTSRPCVTSFLGTYANANHMPNAVLVASDGTLGYIFGGYVASIGTQTQSWSNSANFEYGNVLQFPFPVRIIGASHNINLLGDCDVVLYSDPFGTPVAERTFSYDANQIAASAVPEYALFSSYYDLAANTNAVIAAKPTTSTAVGMSYLTLGAAVHQTAWGGTGYAVSRSSGAFAAQNSQKDRYTIGLILGGFDNGAGGGGGDGVPASRITLGM